VTYENAKVYLVSLGICFLKLTWDNFMKILAYLNFVSYDKLQID